MRVSGSLLISHTPSAFVWILALVWNLWRKTYFLTVFFNPVMWFYLYFTKCHLTWFFLEIIIYSHISLFYILLINIFKLSLSTADTHSFENKTDRLVISHSSVGVLSSQPWLFSSSRVLVSPFYREHGKLEWLNYVCILSLEVTAEHLSYALNLSSSLRLHCHRPDPNHKNTSWNTALGGSVSFHLCPTLIQSPRAALLFFLKNINRTMFFSLPKNFQRFLITFNIRTAKPLSVVSKHGSTLPTPLLHARHGPPSVPWRVQVCCCLIFP